jgi:hypothetical protein
MTCEELSDSKFADDQFNGYVFGSDTRRQDKLIKERTGGDGGVATGFKCDKCATLPNEGTQTDAQGMTELLISNIQFGENKNSPDVLGQCSCHKKWTTNNDNKIAGAGQGFHKKGESDTCPCDELRSYRRLCRKEYDGPKRNNKDGTFQPRWRTVDAHIVTGVSMVPKFDSDRKPVTTEEWGSRRSDMFYIAQSPAGDLAVMGAARGAADAEGDGAEGIPQDTCCEGLLLGSEWDDMCMPLWLFILLWLALLALLTVLAIMLHKNQKDIDTEKNNRKFAQFSTDKELEQVADVQDGEDDDDI